MSTFETMDPATVNITPSAVAIKALEIWNATHSDNSVTERLMQYLQEELHMDPDAAEAVAGQAEPIYNNLKRSLNPPPTDSTAPTPVPKQAMNQAPTTHQNQRPRFPDPEPFDGTRSLYPVFKQKARAKVSIDGAVYGTEAGQVNYLFNRLAGTAAKVVLPWLNTRSMENVTLDSFWHFMDARFSDPQAKAKALDRLQSMKQKNNEDVRDYLARFENELLESEVVMDNALKISTFTRGLRTQVQRNIAMVNNSTDFETFCHEVIRIQDAHRRINILSKGETSFHLSNTTPAKPDPMAIDWEPTRANTTRLNPSRQNSAPQNAQTGRRAKWVTPEVIEKRKANRLCIRCGASGHMISSCPVLPARRPQTNVSASTAYVEPLLEEDNESTVSEKE